MLKRADLMTAATPNSNSPWRAAEMAAVESSGKLDPIARTTDP